jgi:DNA-binding NtrC family response regulator
MAKRYARARDHVLARRETVAKLWAERIGAVWHRRTVTLVTAVTDGPQVLVVDDEPMVREVAEAILGRMGLIVVTASDGKEALRAFSTEPERFAVVLLDLTMPRLSGADTFRQIRAIRPDAAVILMSGYSEEEAGGRFAGEGLAGFLEKPFSTQGLGAAVERVLGRSPTPGDDPSR